MFGCSKVYGLNGRFKEGPGLDPEERESKKHEGEEKPMPPAAQKNKQLERGHHNLRHDLFLLPTLTLPILTLILIT
jgi:hypothetical protein